MEQHLNMNSIDFPITALEVLTFILTRLCENHGEGQEKVKPAEPDYLQKAGKINSEVPKLDTVLPIITFAGQWF